MSIRVRSGRRSRRRRCRVRDCFVSPDTAASVSAIAASASAVFAMVVMVVAARSLAASARDSRDRSRPAVVAELEREFLSPGTINLSIRNFGASVASNVTVAFEPGPPADLEELSNSDVWKWVFQAYAGAISSWPPGWGLSHVVRAGHDVLDAFAVTISYAGPDGLHIRSATNSTRCRSSRQQRPAPRTKTTRSTGRSARCGRWRPWPVGVEDCAALRATSGKSQIHPSGLVATAQQAGWELLSTIWRVSTWASGIRNATKLPSGLPGCREAAGA